MLGASWTNRDCTERTHRHTDFMVVAPYNAHLPRLRKALRADILYGVPVDTVDKFQGRKAQIVFYSIATSIAEDLPLFFFLNIPPTPIISPLPLPISLPI